MYNKTKKSVYSKFTQKGQVLMVQLFKQRAFITHQSVHQKPRVSPAFSLGTKMHETIRVTVRVSC